MTTDLKTVAKIVHEAVAGTRVDDGVRARLAEKLGGAALANSLEQGPDGSLYIAADVETGPVLLKIGSEASKVEAIPFAPTDRANIERFVREVAPGFLPRPQGELPAIATGNRHPEVSLPAAFQAFAEILKEKGVNAASTVQLSATREMTTDAAIAARDGSDPVAAGHTRVSIQHLYHAGLWAAIRAGYRAGYTAEADHVIISGKDARDLAESMERGKEAIHHAAGFTKFTTDTSQVFNLRADRRHPQALSDAEVRAAFDSEFSAEERRWLLAEFAKPCGRYTFGEDDIRRLAVKFGRSLKLNEELFDAIRREKGGAAFDFEPSLDEADTLTTPEELIFNARWLAWRGRPAQLLPPNLGFKKRQAYPETFADLEQYAHGKMWPELLPRVAGEFGGKPLDELKARIAELASVALEFSTTLSVHSGSGKQPAVLHSIREATHGRVNYKISGELQLQLFDVLSEQPAGSEWRGVFDRMVAGCEGFAARHAFGKESELAAGYRERRGSYLGDAHGGRADGNLFLVFWLGNMVGCRDEDGCFFKEKLDRLPGELVSEVRARNTRYIKWLAEHLL